MLDALGELLLKALRKHVTTAVTLAINPIVGQLDDGIDRSKAAAAELIKHARKALEGGLQKQVRQALFGRAQGLFQALGHGARPLGSLAKQMDKLEQHTHVLARRIALQHGQG